MKQVPAKHLHNKVVEQFKESLGAGCTTVKMLEVAEDIVNDMQPKFTDHHLAFFRALLVVYQKDAPITDGFSQEQLLEYAQRIGRHNGMLDIITYITAVIEQQQVDSQQTE